MEARFDHDDKDNNNFFQQGSSFFKSAIPKEAEAVKDFLACSFNYTALLNIKRISDENKKAYYDSLKTSHITRYEDGTIKDISTEHSIKSVFIDNYYRIQDHTVDIINKLEKSQTFSELLENLNFVPGAIPNQYTTTKILCVAGYFSQKANASYYLISLAQEAIKFAAKNRYSIELKPTMTMGKIK